MHEKELRIGAHSDPYFITITDIGKKQALANARLIVAAPDLLEAAKDVLLDLVALETKFEITPYINTLASRIRELRAAIEKAEGKR